MGLLGHVYDWQLPLERAALATAVELAAPRESERLLDVATGTGGLLRELSGRRVCAQAAGNFILVGSPLARAGVGVSTDGISPARLRGGRV